jgi:hypothetical protein
MGTITIDDKDYDFDDLTDQQKGYRRPALTMPAKNGRAAV